MWTVAYSLDIKLRLERGKMRKMEKRSDEKVLKRPAQVKGRVECIAIAVPVDGSRRCSREAVENLFVELS